MTTRVGRDAGFRRSRRRHVRRERDARGEGGRGYDGGHVYDVRAVCEIPVRVASALLVMTSGLDVHTPRTVRESKARKARKESESTYS